MVNEVKVLLENSLSCHLSAGVGQSTISERVSGIFPRPSTNSYSLQKFFSFKEPEPNLCVSGTNFDDFEVTQKVLYPFVLEERRLKGIQELFNNQF